MCLRCQNRKEYNLIYLEVHHRLITSRPSCHTFSYFHSFSCELVSRLVCHITNSVIVKNVAAQLVATFRLMFDLRNGTEDDTEYHEKPIRDTSIRWFKVLCKLMTQIQLMLESLWMRWNFIQSFIQNLNNPSNYNSVSHDLNRIINSEMVQNL